MKIIYFLILALISFMIGAYLNLKHEESHTILINGTSWLPADNTTSDLGDMFRMVGAIMIYEITGEIMKYI